MPTTNVIAVFADVHGNLDALDAVIEDATRAGAQAFVDLGDCVAGPLDPHGTAKRLMALGAITILGNHDRAVLGADPAASAAFARGQLDPDQLGWLAALPPTAELDGGVLACHGSPSDDECYLLEVVTADGAQPRDPAEVGELLADVEAELVLCGHTHVPRLLPLDGGPTVVNPGSVGLPAYDHDVPFPHVMQSGSPHARYALLERRDGSWQVQLRAVAYDWAKAAALARAHGREDWALALLTGLAGPAAPAGAAAGDPDWERRLAAAWASIDQLDEDEFRDRIDQLTSELPASSGVGAFERACAFDSTGHSDRAVPLYRSALELGLTGIRRRRAVIQLASSLRNLGQASESVTLLEAEREAGSDELDDALRGFLALALVDVGREREAVSIALGSLAPHLPRYQRSLANYAAELN